MNYSLIFLLTFVASVAHAQWRLSMPGWNYEFPADHGSHPSFKTEWWYFTGNLKAKKGGEELGYQLTFFRQGVADPAASLPESKFIQRDVKFAHFAVSEISKKKFHHFQKLSRELLARRVLMRGRALLGLMTGPANARGGMISD